VAGVGWTPPASVTDAGSGQAPGAVTTAPLSGSPPPGVAPGRGRFIALEGVDGIGKSTQAARLARRLGARLTRAPGGTDLGRSLRRLLLESTADDEPPVPVETLLVLADRADHVARVVAPALAAGQWVVSDRFSGSTLAYQGYGRGVPLAELRRLCDFAQGGLWPDLNVLLDAEAVPWAAEGPADRIEAAGAAFLARVRDGYRQLAAEEPERWVVVPAIGDLEAVEQSIAGAVGARLGVPPAGAGLTSGSAGGGR